MDRFDGVFGRESHHHQCLLTVECHLDRNPIDPVHAFGCVTATVHSHNKFRIFSQFVTTSVLRRETVCGNQRVISLQWWSHPPLQQTWPCLESILAPGSDAGEPHPGVPRPQGQPRLELATQELETRGRVTAPISTADGLDGALKVYTLRYSGRVVGGPPVSGCLRAVPARLYPSPPRHVVPYLVQALNPSV